MLNLVREGEEDYIEAIRYRRRLKILENFLFFFVLSVSCWNIRFGAICHFRPTNSSSSTENLGIVFTYFAKRTSRGQRGSLRALTGICEFHLSYFRRRKSVS